MNYEDIYFNETAYGMDPDYDPVPFELVGDDYVEYSGDWDHDDEF